MSNRCGECINFRNMDKTGLGFCKHLHCSVLNITRAGKRDNCNFVSNCEVPELTLYTETMKIHDPKEDIIEERKEQLEKNKIGNEYLDFIAELKRKGK